jgi:hydrogenase nickel incorporation protein HypA/HybF
MHEGAIIHSLLEIAKEIKEKEKLTKITKINVIVGKFHQIVEEVMLTNFEFMKTEYEGFENTLLAITEKEVNVRCKLCGSAFTIEEPIFICPHCDSFETELISGKELYIESLEGCEGADL